MATGALPPPRVRLCRGCGVLLIAGRTCTCDDETVHLITSLGPTGLPGRIARAELGRMRRTDGRWMPDADRVVMGFDGSRDGGEPVFYYYDEAQTFTAGHQWPPRPRNTWTFG